MQFITLPGRADGRRSVTDQWKFAFVDKGLRRAARGAPARHVEQFTARKTALRFNESAKRQKPRRQR